MVFFEDEENQINSIGKINNANTPNGFSNCDNLKYFEMPKGDNDITLGAWAFWSTHLFSSEYMQEEEIKNFLKNVVAIRDHALGYITSGKIAKVVNFSHKLKQLDNKALMESDIYELNFGDENNYSLLEFNMPNIWEGVLVGGSADFIWIYTDKVIETDLASFFGVDATTGYGTIKQYENG